MNDNNQKVIPIFIGYDFRERAATNVLIDSLYQYSSYPLSITPLVTYQLVKQGYHSREREEKQSTDFSFTRFLVPFLMNFQGWAIFMDCDMLCFSDIGELWEERNEKYSLLCVKHNHQPVEKTKFQGEIQSSYPMKNWSSLMLMNCKKCKKLSIDYVNNASGLDLHRFNWLENVNEIGAFNSDGWNELICSDNNAISRNDSYSKLIHWTLGGPWFKDQRNMGGKYARKWFSSREEAMKLWD